MPSLKIIEGQEKDRVLELSGERVTLGRSHECDLQIKDEESSRVHAELVLRKGEWHVRDMGSSNGTFLNGLKVNEELVHGGDQIRIGGVTIEYLAEAAGERDAKLAAKPEHAEHGVEHEAKLAEGAEAKAEPAEGGEKVDGIGAITPALLLKAEEAGPVEGGKAVAGPGEANEAHKVAGLVEGDEAHGERKAVEPPGFEIKRRVRSNEMYVTYLATELAMDRPAAVDLVNPACYEEADAVITRLRSAARLEHPVLAHVYSVGCEDGTVFVAREPALGRSMWSSCGKLTIENIVEIGGAVAGALVEAHSAHVVHGSLRPDRIIRTERGHIKLAGLGMPAPKVGELSREPDLQHRPNRIAYLAPEQIAGDEMTEASDVYALGAVLYHMLTGQAPFAAICEAKLAPKIGAEAVRPVRELKPETPAELARAIEKMLARVPSDRQCSMAEVLQALQTALAKREAVAVAPVRVSERAAKRARRPRRLSLGSLIVYVLAGIILLLAFVAARRAGNWFIRQGIRPAQSSGLFASPSADGLAFSGGRDTSAK